MTTSAGERSPSHRGRGRRRRRAVTCAVLVLAACVEVEPAPTDAPETPPPPALAGVYEGGGIGNDRVAPPGSVTVESPLPGVLTFSWPTCADGTPRFAVSEATPDPLVAGVKLRCDDGFYFEGLALFQADALHLSVGLYRRIAFTTAWYGDASFDGVRVSPGS